jgi:hypothetical protein
VKNDIEERAVKSFMWHTRWTGFTWKLGRPVSASVSNSDQIMSNVSVMLTTGFQCHSKTGPLNVATYRPES